MKNILTFLLIVAIALGVACGGQQQAESWEVEDSNPVTYDNPEDNMEIEIDIDLPDGTKSKKKVKRGDYNSGRYKTFTPVKRTTTSSSSTSSRSSSTPSRSTSSTTTKSSSSSSSRSTSSSSSSRRK